MKTALMICIALASANLAFAQTPPPSTNPSSASSPHQRDTTSKQDKETPTPSKPDPAAASSPHQRQVTEGADDMKGKQDKMINDCVAKQQSMDSSLSKDQAKKTCMEQMKKQSQPPK
jgi:hypothetical protein